MKFIEIGETGEFLQPSCGDLRAVQVQFPKLFQACYGIQREIGDTHAPESGVCSLFARNVQPPQPRHRVKHLQAPLRELVSSQGKLFEPGQRGQELKARIRYLREANVERFERRHPGEH